MEKWRGTNYPVIVVHFVHTKNVYIVQNTILVGTCNDLFDTYRYAWSCAKFCSSDDRIVTEVRDYNDCGERHLTNQ